MQGPGVEVKAEMTANVWQVRVQPEQVVHEGDVLVVVTPA